MQEAEENLDLALGQLLMEQDELKYKIIEICPKNRFRKFNDELASSPLKVVHKAYDAEEGKEVLWHTIKAKRIPKREIARIHSQLSLMKSIKHNNIINCLDYWVNVKQREIVFITEIMDGGCLRSYLDKIKNTKFKVIKGWCQQILKGIAHLHQQSKPITHQRIRCENIYINSTTNQVKLGEIGILFTSSNPFQSLTGSYQWTAPQISSETHLETSADIYSFGMTLLQLVTGQKPYSQCRNDAQVCRMVSRKIKPKSLKQVIYPELKQIIQMCISHDIESRPTAKNLLLHPFWRPNQQIDLVGVKLTFDSYIQEKIKKRTSKQSQKSDKQIKLGQNVIKTESENEVRYIFQFGSKKKYQIKIQKESDDQFEQYINFLTKKLQDKHFSKQNTNQLLSYGNRFEQRQTVKDDQTHFLSYNNPTMKTMRFDQFYQSRIKEDDNKKSTTNISELNEGGQGNALGRVQQTFVAMYEIYKNKIQFQNFQDSFQQARFLIQRKQLDDLQSIQRQRIKMKKNGNKGNKAFLANSINFIDFLNNSEAPWPNEIYQTERDITLKHTLLYHPEDVLSLNFSSIQNNKEQINAQFQLENARYILQEEDEVHNHNLNKSFIVQQNTESMKTKIPYFELVEENKQKQTRQKFVKFEEQEKSGKQLFQKKPSYKKQEGDQDSPESKTDILI